MRMCAFVPTALPASAAWADDAPPDVKKTDPIDVTVSGDAIPPPSSLLESQALAALAVPMTHRIDGHPIDELREIGPVTIRTSIS